MSSAPPPGNRPRAAGGTRPGPPTRLASNGAARPRSARKSETAGRGEGGRRISRSAHAPTGPRSEDRPRSATPEPQPAPPRRPCTGCRHSAGEPSRSPGTAPAPRRAVRCGPRRSSPSRRNRKGRACSPARSPPPGAQAGPGTAPQGAPAAAAGGGPRPPRPVRPPPARRRLPRPPSQDRRTTAAARPRPASPTSCRTAPCEARH